MLVHIGPLQHLPPGNAFIVKRSLIASACIYLPSELAHLLGLCQSEAAQSTSLYGPNMHACMQVFPHVAQESKLFAMLLEGYWMDVGQPHDFLVRLPRSLFC